MNVSAAMDVSAAGRRRATAAGAIGNGVEWFDYGIYGYFAATIGAVFFPSDDPTVSLLAAFAAFAVTFFIRPFGGFVFGSLGDRIGRQRTLATVVILMSVSTFAVGLLPGYAQIGVWAPIFLVVLRLGQGLSAGGEAAGAASFLAEYAPDRRRALACSWLNISAFAGALAGSGLALLLATLLSEDAMASWGWRIPFLVAGPLGVIGLYLRLRIQDSPYFRALESTGEVAVAPIRETLTKHARAIVLCGAIAATWGVGYYMTLSYIPSYLSSVSGFSSPESFLCTSVALLVAIVTLPITAHLSDRIGRKPVTIAACFGYILASYPVFVLMGQGTLPSALMAQVLLGVMLGSYGGAPFMAMVELFPTRVRYSAYAIGYNIAIAALGGTAPLLSTYLIDATGNDLAPAFYLVFAAVISLVGILFTVERAGTPLRQAQFDDDRDLRREVVEA